MNWLKNLFIVSIIIFSNSLLAKGMPYFCNKEIESLPIQANGRVKPLYVHSNELIKYMTGKKKVGEYSATTAFCLLTLKGMGMPVNLDVHTVIEHVELQEMLGIKDKSISLEKLLPQVSELSMKMRTIKEETSFKKALQKTLQKVSLYQSITSADNWVLPSVSDGAISWQPFHSFVTPDKVAMMGQMGNEAFLKLFQDAAQKYAQVKGEKHLIEYLFAKLKLPVWSLVLSLIAISALTLVKNFKLGLIFALISLLNQLVYMSFRVYISGRAPITNMYETVMFSGFGALLLALVIGHYRKEKLFVYMGLAYNICTLMMMNFAGTMLSPVIGPLVPVLRDNFWLSTHVTTIILAYGAYALSWVLANYVLAKKSFSSIAPKELNYYSDLIYTSLKYASVLLAAGIILGGVWADYSWGRFWGWDPKETWSLIVLCIYMAILHGRYTSWIKPKLFVPLVAGAFMSVMMAWFGVNYILASGLHSYGFSEGGAIFLGSFFAIQTGFLIIAKIKETNFKTEEKA